MVDRAKLLDAANGASQLYATLHLGFMALCAYVLVIVFSTSDLDLLLGKSVTLPVLGAALPLVGFYAAVPFLLVLVHFNLLLQLQALSRKLYVFDSAAPCDGREDGLRDQLHIFPFTSYLVGRPGPIVEMLNEFLISVTMVLLPLMVLLALQLRFLAYQDQSITWIQRSAVWLDMTLALILWPIIMHPKDDWRAYWRELIQGYAPHWRIWPALALTFAALIFSFECAASRAAMTAVSVFIISPLIILALGGRKALYGARLGCSVPALIVSVLLLALSVRFHMPFLLLGLLATVPLAAFWNPSAPRGAFALLTTLLLGLSVPPALLVDGEGLEAAMIRQPKPHDWHGRSTAFCDNLLLAMRHLMLEEQVLLARPTSAENVALIRNGEWQKVRGHVEPIDLQNRSLRGARLMNAILVGAKLRWVQLQGAEMIGAHLEWANLQNAQLQGANLNSAFLQESYMYGARLQKAALEGTQLQGADMGGTQLQGAILRGAGLEAANLHHAQLQGADLEGAQMQAAILEWARLQGADLQGAQLNGVDLQHALVAGAVFEGQPWLRPAEGELVDARAIDVKPIQKQELNELTEQIEHPWGIEFQGAREASIARLEQAAKGGAPKVGFYSCLYELTSVIQCMYRYDPENKKEVAEYNKALLDGLIELSCDSPDIAEGVINRMQQRGTGSQVEELDIELGRRMLSKTTCPGVKLLDPETKDWLRAQVESADWKSAAKH
jgi:uncharacterized protein YjbI with pentapeptide repeats